MAEYDDAFGAIDEENKRIRAANKAVMKGVKAMKGVAFAKNLQRLFVECEVGGGWLEPEYKLLKELPRSLDFVEEPFGKEIKGYWVEQWNPGMESDSWEGFIYVKISEACYIKAGFKM